MMPNKPKVSILLLVYNHGKFLKTCFDSVVSQKTNFEFEVIVGDDCSSDDSRQIIEEYSKTYPQLFRPMLHKTRFGGAGVGNLMEIAKYMTGDYFVLLEGDDFFTSPEKLQKQVDFLDAHQDFALCFHNARVFYDDNSQPEYLLNEGIEKDIFTVRDLIGEQEVWFMATASVMFRQTCFPGFPDWFAKSKSGDIPLQILVAKNGKIKYLNEVMSAYRKHAAGTSFSDKYNDAEFLNNRVEMYQNLNHYLEYKYEGIFKKLYAWYYAFMLNSSQYQDNYFKGFLLAIKYLYFAGFPSNKIKYIVLKHIVPKSLSATYFYLRTGKNHETQ